LKTWVATTSGQPSDRGRLKNRTEESVKVFDVYSFNGSKTGKDPQIAKKGSRDLDHISLVVLDVFGFARSKWEISPKFTKKWMVRN